MVEKPDLNYIKETIEEFCLDGGIDIRIAKRIIKRVSEGMIGSLLQDELFVLFDALGVQDGRNDLAEAVYRYAAYLWANRRFEDVMEYSDANL